jgi:DtxR family Mn-dependent transcriptional regulator
LKFVTVETASHTVAVEDYAKAIYSLCAPGPQTASTNDLAARLGVTPASVSAMVKKLAEEGLVEHVPYRGVRLTLAGERVALGVLRRHRLLELFLAEALEVPWEQVHSEAERLEHAVSDELAELIAAKLGNPSVDPHGDPIPTRDLVIDDRPTEALTDLEPDTVAIFVRVSDSDPAMLRYLAGLGIRIGDELQMLGQEPFDGPFTVRFGQVDHMLGATLARAMRVTRSAA